MKPEDMELLSSSGGNNFELIKDLINRGADINARDGNGSTPLHQAAIGGFGDISAQIISYLISKGAKVNAVNFEGQTPLDLCIEGLRPRSTVEFLKYKARPNTQNTIHLSTVLNQNYYGVEDVVVQIQNVHDLKEIILKLEDSKGKESLLDKLSYQESRLTEKLPRYLAKKSSEGYESIEEKQKNLRDSRDLAETIIKDTEKKLLPEKAAPKEEMDDVKEEGGVKALSKTSDSNACDETVPESIEKLVIGEASAEVIES